MLKEPLKDGDGQEVGTVVWHCTSAEDVAWVCDAYLDMTASAPAEEGTLVAEGLFEGFNGESRP